MPEGDALRPAGAHAAGGHDRRPEEEGPIPLAPKTLPAGVGMGEDADPELLDWGSIEDEDGVFGQLSTGKVQDPDPAGSEAVQTGAWQISVAGELRVDTERLRGDAGGAGAVTTAARLNLAGAGGTAVADHLVPMGTLQAAHPASLEASESSIRQGYYNSWQAMAACGLGGGGERAESSNLHGPALNSASAGCDTADHIINGPQPASASTSMRAS